MKFACTMLALVASVLATEPRRPPGHNQTHHCSVQFSAESTKTTDTYVPVFFKLPDSVVAGAKLASGQDILMATRGGAIIPRIVEFASGYLVYRDPAQDVATGGTPLECWWGSATDSINDTSGVFADCHGGTVDYALVILFEGNVNNYGPTPLTIGTKNSPTYSSSGSPLGQYIVLDGVNQWAYVLDNAVLRGGNGTTDNPLTIMAWVKFDDFGASNYIACKGIASATIDYDLATTITGGQLEFLPRDGSGVIYAGVRGKKQPVATWLHLAATYTGSSPLTNVKLYKNGVSADSTTLNAGTYIAMDGDADTLGIGRYTTIYYDGNICKQFIIQGALSQGAIQTAYANQMGFATNASLTVGAATKYLAGTGWGWLDTFIDRVRGWARRWGR